MDKINLDFEKIDKKIIELNSAVKNNNILQVECFIEDINTALKYYNKIYKKAQFEDFLKDKKTANDVVIMVIASSYAYYKLEKVIDKSTGLLINYEVVLKNKQILLNDFAKITKTPFINNDYVCVLDALQAMLLHNIIIDLNTKQDVANTYKFTQKSEQAFNKYSNIELEKVLQEVINTLNKDLDAKAKKKDVRYLTYCLKKSCNGGIIKTLNNKQFALCFQDALYHIMRKKDYQIEYNKK